MAQNSNFPSDFSMEQAMAFINSPAGRKLAKMLQHSQDPELAKAADLAAAGKADQAKDAISHLMDDPKIRELLKQFGG